MNQADILRMAREAGLISRHGCRETASDEMLERFYTLASAAELRRLRSANVKLAGALDMIRETLQGGNVDDLLYIINTALEEHRSTT